MVHDEKLKVFHYNGFSVETLAAQFGMSPSWVQKFIRFAETDERPQVTGGKRTEN